MIDARRRQLTVIVIPFPAFINCGNISANPKFGLSTGRNSVY
jgi:hypothetical protein